MKVLFDHNVNRHFRRHLPAHQIKTTAEMGWDRLANGVLLQSAASANFEVFLTIDKKIRHEHNLNKLALPVVILDCLSNALPELIPFAPHVLALLKQSLSKRLYIIQPDGQILELGGTTPP